MDPDWPKTDPHIAQQCWRERLSASHCNGEFLGLLGQATEFLGLSPETAEFHCFRSSHLLLDQAASSSEIMNLTRDRNGSIGLGDSFAARAENTSQMSLLRTSFASQISAQNLNWVGYGSAGMMSNDPSEGCALGLDLSANPTDLDCLYESGKNFRKNDSTYHCGQSSLTNHSSEISNQDSPNFRGESNTIHGFVSSTANGNQGLNVTSLALEKTVDKRQKAWPPEAAGNELALLPVYPEVHINSGMRVNSNVWYGKESNSDQTMIRKAVMEGINGVELRNTSLTLSSTNRLIEMGMSANVNMLEHSSSIITMSGKGIQEVTGISAAPSCTSGPLGPFTGYASILKSSKFLKPAQLLLHEICGIPDSFMIQTSSELERRPEEVGFGADSGMDSLNSCSSGSLRPEYQQLKAKLLHMQVEVCKRYRLYHQQMHMVFSSFQTVAGLSSVTPCISLALETILRNFDFLKNAILYQLRNLKKFFREELSFPSFGPGTNKGDPRLSKFKCVNQNFPKHKYSTVGEERFHAQRLRMQRGLPEHAVSILRAWLFEHFLHPYPTDTDKYILASQTGLSRNQVSNWFINARVRVWRPIVEEIHILDTKQQSDPSQNPAGDGGSTTQAVDTSCRNFYQGWDLLSRRSTTQVIEAGLTSNTDWNQVIRHGGVSIGSQYLSGNEGSLMELAQAPRGGDDFRELGSASLALGLPRTVEFRKYQQ